MSYRVLTPSPAERLVSLAALKAELGITVSTYDAKLTRVLNAVARAFAGELGRPLPRQRYLESLPGSGRRRLLLSFRPLDPDSVSVELDGTAITVGAEEFAVEDPDEGILWRSSSWPTCRQGVGERPEETVAVTYKAGWVLPEFLSTFVALDATIANATTKWIRPSSPQLSPFLFEVTTAGTLGASEPTWPTVAGDAVTSGSAVLTARVAQELPADIYEVALITAKQWYGGALETPIGIQSESRDGVEIAYDFVGARDGFGLPPFAKAVLRQYR